MPLQLISTDFDGTIFAEFSSPPVHGVLQNLLAALQHRGVRWVINTGRDMGSLMETLARAQLPVHPDALVLVEREIYVRRDSQYVPLHDWNDACTRDHRELFGRLLGEIPAWVHRLQAEHAATFYEDAFSPLCVIAETLQGADRIQAKLEEYARPFGDLAVVRNDVYIRLAHMAYNKGTALSRIAAEWKLHSEAILAAGDHYNDLPMLDRAHARWLVAPANAIPEVKQKVQGHGGYISSRPSGEGVAQGIEYVLEQAELPPLAPDRF